MTDWADEEASRVETAALPKIGGVDLPAYRECVAEALRATYRRGLEAAAKEADKICFCRPNDRDPECNACEVIKAINNKIKENK